MGVLKEFKDARRLYNATKNNINTTFLKENGFDIDWIGRPYKIYTVDKEYWKNKKLLNTHIFHLMENDAHVFEKMRLATIIYPITTLDFKNYVVLVQYTTMYTSFKNTVKLIKLLFFIMILFGIIWAIQYLL